MQLIHLLYSRNSRNTIRKKIRSNPSKEAEAGEGPSSGPLQPQRSLLSILSPLGPEGIHRMKRLLRTEKRWAYQTQEPLSQTLGLLEEAPLGLPTLPSLFSPSL